MGSNQRLFSLLALQANQAAAIAQINYMQGVNAIDMEYNNVPTFKVKDFNQAITLVRSAADAMTEIVKAEADGR